MALVLAQHFLEENEVGVNSADRFADSSQDEAAVARREALVDVVGEHA